MESSAFCQDVLAARMREGSLPTCPIKSDVKNYSPVGKAAEAQAMLAGFPCQARPLGEAAEAFVCSRCQFVEPEYLRPLPGIITSWIATRA